jgi:hypothetical protein
MLRKFLSKIDDAIVRVYEKETQQSRESNE